MNRTADDLTMAVKERVAPYEPILRRLGFTEGTHNPALLRAGVMSWLLDLDASKYDANRMVVVFEKDGSITIGAGDKTSAKPADYSWNYRSLPPVRLYSLVKDALWEVERKQMVAMKKVIAGELLKVARELMGKDDVIEWAKNLARNYRHGYGSGIKSQLIDAAKEIGLNWQDIDRRYQHAGGDDLASEKGVYFVLTGKQHPAGGYAWASSRTAAVKDLAEIKAIIPETRKAQAEHNRKMEEYRSETNRMWDEATRELHEKTVELLSDIKEELTSYFKSAGKGIRSVGSSENLVEVFLGSDDGVNRYQSKVSTFLSFTFEGREEAYFMMRNEDGDQSVRLTLSDKSTVDKMMQEVKKADKKGFWDMPEME
jgi:hypothetical protein